jgi:hypothetical protein
LAKRFAPEIEITPPPVKPTPTPVNPDPPPVNPNTAKIAAAKGLIQKIAGQLALGLDFKDVSPDGGDSIEELLTQVDDRR